MSSAPRRILVDDADSAIQYGAGWSAADTTKFDTLGNFGPVYGGTTHATSSSGSSLSFKFSGTSMAVFGTIDIANTNGVVTPTFSCLVDGVAIPEQNPTFQFPENNWNLCEQTQLSSGTHTLTIIVQTMGQAFYFDYLLYTPTADVDLDGAVLEYMNTDAAVSFQSGWQGWGAQNVTQVNGASVTLNFHGTAVSLIGYVPAELPKTSAGASYTIDGGASTSISLAGLASDSTTTLYTVPILQVTGLSPAAHSLVVTYGGDNTHTPLPVGWFYVTNSVLAAAAPPPPPPSSQPQQQPTSSSATHTATLTKTFTSAGSVFTTTSLSVSVSPVVISSSSALGSTAGGSALDLGTSVASSPSPSPSSSSSVGLVRSSSTHLGPIIGAAVGGLVVLVALLAGTLLWCRKRRRHRAGVTLERAPVAFSTAGTTDTEFGSESRLTSSAAYANEKSLVGTGNAVGGGGRVQTYMQARGHQPSDSLTSGVTTSAYGSSASASASPFSPPSNTDASASSGDLLPPLSPVRARRPVVYQQGVDSGMRIPVPVPETQSLLEPEVVELPPGYTRH